MQSFFLAFCHDFSMFLQLFFQDGAFPRYHSGCTSAESSAVTARYQVFFSTEKTTEWEVHSMPVQGMHPRKFFPADSFAASSSPQENKAKCTLPSTLPVLPVPTSASQKTHKSTKEISPLPTQPLAASSPRTVSHILGVFSRDVLFLYYFLCFFAFFLPHKTSYRKFYCNLMWKSQL